LAVDNG